jgi:hypothetical protein
LQPEARATTDRATANGNRRMLRGMGLLLVR